MASSSDLGTIIPVVISVIFIVFGIAQALIKGKKINLDNIFTPEKQTNDDFTEFNDAPLMVVDAQGNIIKPPRKKTPAPPIKNRRKKAPAPVNKGLKTIQTATKCKIDSSQSNSYVDLIRNHANSAVIMHEILGKPKALQ